MKKRATQVKYRRSIISLVVIERFDLFLVCTWIVSPKGASTLMWIVGRWVGGQVSVYT